MRLKLISTILFMLPSFIFSQEWEYYYKQGSNYPHQYTLKPDFAEPNELFILKQSEKDKSSTVSGIVKDYSNSNIFGVNIHLIDKSGKYITGTITDKNGYFEISTYLTSFSIKFSLIDKLKNEEFNIESEHFTKTSLSVKLGRDQVLDFFVVFSKQKLTDSKLIMLINCVKPFIYYENEKVYDCDNDSIDYYISTRL